MQKKTSSICVFYSFGMRSIYLFVRGDKTTVSGLQECNGKRHDMMFFLVGRAYEFIYFLITALFCLINLHRMFILHLQIYRFLNVFRSVYIIKLWYKRMQCVWTEAFQRMIYSNHIIYLYALASRFNTNHQYIFLRRP